MQHNNRKTISKLTLTLLACASLVGVAHAADANQNQPKRNPFTKTTPMVPNGLPSGLPNDLPPPNYNQIVNGTSSRDLSDTPEAREAKIYWENMKIVGIFNNHVLLRLDENDDDNNTNGSSNSNGSNGNNNRSNNSNNSNGNNNTPVTTIMTTLGDKFLLNKNFYTLKKEKDSYIIYNRNNQPMHSMILENNSTKLIPRINANGSGTGTSTGANSATR